MLRIFMVSIFSSHILISDYQISYHWKMISLLSKLILFHLLSSYSPQFCVYQAKVNSLLFLGHYLY